jgi:hypothetical protein
VLTRCWEADSDLFYWRLQVCLASLHVLFVNGTFLAAPILLVADLFHPVDVLAVHGFLAGDVSYCLSRLSETGAYLKSAAYRCKSLHPNST